MNFRSNFLNLYPIDARDSRKFGEGRRRLGDETGWALKSVEILTKTRYRKQHTCSLLTLTLPKKRKKKKSWFRSWVYQSRQSINLITQLITRSINSFLLLFNSFVNFISFSNHDHPTFSSIASNERMAASDDFLEEQEKKFREQQCQPIAEPLISEADELIELQKVASSLHTASLRASPVKTRL